MSLSALVFNHANFINLKEDLTEILDIGNNLYSVLSESLTGQTFLLLIDLPGTVRIRETQYKLQFSESYVSNLFGSCFPIDWAILTVQLLRRVLIVCSDRITAPSF